MKHDKYALIEENGKIVGIKPIKSEPKRGIQTKFPREEKKADKFVALMVKLGNEPKQDSLPQYNFTPSDNPKEYKQFKDALYKGIRESTKNSL